MARPPGDAPTPPGALYLNVMNKKTMRLFRLFLLSAALGIVGCAGPNPNVGERSTDFAWTKGDFARAVELVRPAAEAGKPWAQIRLAMFYENGMGVEKSSPKAVEWYKKAAMQKEKGEWAEGKMIGATGRDGYFNQNSDARIAQRNLATIYLKGEGVEKDLIQAYLNIRTVMEEIQGRPIFFCCEFSGGRYFSAKEIDEIYEKVVNEMSSQQKTHAEALYLQSRSK